MISYVIMDRKKRKMAIKRAQTCERGCLVTGMRVMHGNNVSHSRRHTKRLFRQNMHTKSVYSVTLQTEECVKLSTRGIRTLNKYGGLDAFLLKCKNRNLTLVAKKLKNRVLKAQSTQNISNNIAK